MGVAVQLVGPMTQRSDALAAIEPGKRDALDSLSILREHAHEPPLEYKVARHMAASWKSRQKARLAERDKQLAAIEESGPLGV